MERNARESLGRKDWIAAAYEAFEINGIEAVKVDPLSKRLGVTRGSFYWHFRNLAELMQAVLEAWRDRQTETVIAQNEEAGGDPRDRLRRLLETCARDDGRFEVGIRLWMVKNAGARAVVVDVDRRRTAYIATLLAQIGLSETAAERLAPVAYSAWLGEYSGATTRDVEERVRDMGVLFDLLVGQSSPEYRPMPN
ncbi:MAG: TetR/AcrR family transcriptional regulator [Inquilinaceae bacterium]